MHQHSFFTCTLIPNPNTPSPPDLQGKTLYSIERLVCVNPPIPSPNTPSSPYQQLNRGGAGKQIVFRLTARADYGCAKDKCGGCALKNYGFTDTSLQISTV